MHSFLHFTLKNPGSGRLVVVGDLQDMSGIDPVVGPTAHNMVAVDIVFVDGHLQVNGWSARRVSRGRFAPTLLYVAL